MQERDRVGNERRLRAAVLQGDEAAWQAWYDTTSAGLRAYVYWRCPGRRDLADELVQETWLTAVRRVSTFRPEAGAFAAWIRGIAANLIRNRLRERRDHLGSLVNKDVADCRCPATEADSELVARALAALPRHYEDVLRAKYLDGLSVHAIADETGNSEKAIESLLTRARQAFRESYQAAELNDG